MTSVTMEWESRLGRRFRVRDLYILSPVVKSGGMAKAARQLGMTQPSVSAAIANLEHMLGVRLLDRSPRGIEPTIYADAMLKRSVTVFDELIQSVRDVEFLANPTTGELWIGCPESICATLLPRFIERFSKQYPNVSVHVSDVPPPAIKHSGLRDRKFDLIFLRHQPDAPDHELADDLSVECLFDDPLVIAAGLGSRWAGRRSIAIAELIDEPWYLTPPDTWNYLRIAEAFEAQGLEMPKVRLFGFSMHLLNHFVANGSFLTAHPKSVARFCALKALPIRLPVRPWPIAIVTLKDRTLSPVAERFIACTREVANSIASESVAGKKSKAGGTRKYQAGRRR
jgi:DNA-binding transcriptional LysR family regulator